MATTDLERLVVELVADVRGYQAELQQSQEQTRGWSTQVQRHIGSVGKAFAGLSVGAAATGIAMVTKRALENAEELDRLSRSVGSTVEEIQRLTYAFGEYGLAQDDVADALNTLADRSQDALSGTESFIEDFQLLGVTVDELRGKRPAEIFSLVAEEASKIEGPGERAAGLVRIFGDELGRRLAPLALEGADGLRELGNEVHDLNGVLSELDVERMAAANREFRQMRQIMDAQTAQAVAANAEELRGLAEAMGLAERAAISGAAAWSGYWSFLGTQLGAASAGVELSDVVSGISEITRAIEEQEDVIFSLQKRMEGSPHLFGGDDGQGRLVRDDDGNVVGSESMNPELLAAQQELERLQAMLRAAQADRWEIDTGDFPERVSDSISGGPSAGEMRRAREQQFADLAQQHRQALMEEERRQIDQDQKMIEHQRDRFDRIHEAALEAADERIALEEFRFRRKMEVLDEEQEAMRERGLLTLERERQFAQARIELEESHSARVREIRDQAGNRLADDTNDAWEEMSVHADQAARNMQDAFADFLFRPFDDGVEGMVESFADAIERMVANAAAANLFDSLGGLASNENDLISAVGQFFGGSSVQTIDTSGFPTKVSGSIAGGAHEGMTKIPREGTWWLDRGERVLSPDQNRDLMEFMGSRQGGVEVHIHNEGAPMQVEETSTERGPDGRLVVRAMMRQELNRMMASGELDRPMRMNYGARRRPS